MACFYHPNREATATCNSCGRSLCTECGGAYQPPTCVDCICEHVREIKSKMFTSIAISIVLMIVGCAITEGPEGVLLAGIPYGWIVLNSITPTMFVWMPLVGWLIYFIVKFLLAYFIGLVALPVKLFIWISELVRAKNLQDSINHRGR